MKKIAALIIACLLMPGTPVSLAEPLGTRGGEDGEKYIEAINFPNVELRNFIQAMNVYLRENFVLAPGVSGNITVYSGRPIPLSEAQAFFHSVLNLYGFTAVPSGEVTHILPLAEARGRNIEVGVGRDTGHLHGLGDRVLTQIVPLRHAKPETIVPLLSALISRTGNIGADTETGSLVITDAASNISKLLEVIIELDQPLPKPEETLHVYNLNNANAQELAQVLKTIAEEQVAPARRARDAQVKTSIVAVPATNSLLITARPEIYASLENIIRDLDRLPKQVLIEALVVEVSGELLEEFGVQWQYGTTGSKYGGGALLGGEYGRDDLLDIAAGGRLVPRGNLLAGILRGDTVGLLLNLYSRHRDFNVLSTPQIVTADNKEAAIHVGRTIPVVTGRDFFDADRDRFREQVEYRDVGISLLITPQISHERNVRLEVELDVEDIIDPGERPVTSKRTASSSLVLRDGETMILGGLMDDAKTRTEYAVPGFSRIPILGRLFRSVSETGEKTNLYIFITPRVITSQAEASEITDLKKEESRLDDRSLPEESR